jgi:glycosyltransferase involved in cell wall biosynthesis
MRTESGPMKVLYCESNVDGTIGGSHYCLLYLVENLDRRQFEPTVLFYQEHALMDRFQAAGETIVLRRGDMVQWGAGGGILGLPAAMARRVVNFGRYLRLIGRHVTFLRERGIDLVHLNNSITRHHDWMIASFIVGVPCVTHERGLNPQYGFFDRLFARRLALIIPMSQWIQDHMTARGVSRENMRVMYDGVDPEGLKVSTPPDVLRAQWNVRPDQPVVGIVGNIRTWKGQETVLRAMTKVVQRYPDAVCFLVGAAGVGDKPYEEALHVLVAQAGIEANVRFAGYQRDVPSYVNMMDFVIHASIEPEPFGMVVLEAMAQRKAVVGSRAGGVVEMVVEGETGYTFPPADADTLAARMLELLDEPARCRRMGERGYERLTQSFTLTRYMHDVHAAYRAILAKRPVPPEIGWAAKPAAH